MQLDMHYYGTYAIARAAGIAAKDAKIIATAAQYVDDNIVDEDHTFPDGGKVEFIPTAHHTLSKANLDRDDQRKVWVPFHFLPGEGLTIDGINRKPAGSTAPAKFTNKLVCEKDSRLARDMMGHHIGLATAQFALPLIGIGAHVYVDTFSHYGFSGVSSSWNKLDNDAFANQPLKYRKEDGQLSVLPEEILEHIQQKAKQFRRDYGRENGFIPNIRKALESAAAKLSDIADATQSEVAEVASGALGHGAALTFPDRPYLIWQLKYQGHDPQGAVVRDNPATFLEACRALHNLFDLFAAQHYGTSRAETARPFSEIEATVRQILQTPAKLEDRIAAWQQAAGKGELFPNRAREEIPVYLENGAEWQGEADQMRRLKDSAGAIEKNIVKFHQAAEVHRTYVLRDLLPKYGIVVT